MFVLQGFPYQLFCSLSVCLVVLAVGMSVGWTAPTLKKVHSNTSELRLTESEASWMAAMHEPGHVLAALPAGLLLARWGPLWCLRAAALFNLLGWALLLLGRASFAVVCAGRLSFGASMGVAFTVVPLYLGEVASPRLRGMLTTTFQAMLYFGHLVEFVLGPWLSYCELAAVSMAVPLLFLATSFLIVESPYFLLKKGRYEEAGLAYSRLSGETRLQEVEVQLHTMQEMLAESATSGAGRQLREAVSSRHRDALLVVAAVAVLQRCSGMSAVVAYAALTFPSTAGGLDASQYTILFGAVVFLYTFVAAGLVDWVGRRRLTLASCLGCCLAEVAAGAYFLAERQEPAAAAASWVPFVAITSYACFYAVGLGPVVAVLQGEMFAPEVKGVSSAVVTVAHATASFAVTKTYRAIRDAVGFYLNFFLFSAASLAAAVFVYFYLPENKRKTLQEVQKDQRYFARRK